MSSYKHGPSSIIRILLAFLLGFSYLGLTPPSIAQAATITVDILADENDHSCIDGDCSLRDAIEVSNPGDQIR